jgi:general secretion pathway protein F
MSALQIFPPLAVEMIGVGEESGTLVEMMDQVAKTYDGEVKHSLSMFLAAFEPLLILLMVGIIAILAMAVLLPILNMNNQLNTMA